MPKSCKRSTHQYDPVIAAMKRVCLSCPHCQTRASAGDAWADAADCACPICVEEAKDTMREDPRVEQARRS